MRAAKQKFARDGFEVKLKGPHHGCDFIATKGGVDFFVEVKGRTNLRWSFIQFSEKESEQLERNPHFLVALVKISKKTERAEKVKLLHKKDFAKHQVAAVRWFLRPEAHQAILAS